MMALFYFTLTDASRRGRHVLLCSIAHKFISCLHGEYICISLEKMVKRDLQTQGNTVNNAVFPFLRVTNVFYMTQAILA